MAKSVNQVILMGNLTRDPELRQTPSGQNVCSFSIALNRSYKDQKTDEWKEVTDFVDIVCWAGLAERVSQYLSKGSRCLVIGRLQSSSWEQDGKKRSKVDVLANDVTFLDGRGGGGDGDSASSFQKSSSSESSAPTEKKQKDVVIEDIDDEPVNLDDIPF